ncbi:hypothetical protein TBLA_0G01930 [Henningerozyma blattae CBS 6284]|uniref:Manganese resistance protein MNR2 n=1 Tax=Henningerozyma blattae (strain ATCC 34711 / CBS 6284 / DSM 70876 / NBRC 10599 / NRRL Y-10934 / UCD 77-7) TaxID=1071380 RepID=I2H6Y3_HENB6|nr:hypothetical protein TBLA_0G01930 [Tetrapisispora blattae CBS 6284]CCH62135.1 hypothetical protein TBLA_0G01930 [Tetrapisispora blattae CBS 6284]
MSRDLNPKETETPLLSRTDITTINNTTANDNINIDNVESSNTQSSVYKLPHNSSEQALETSESNTTNPDPHKNFIEIDKKQDHPHQHKEFHDVNFNLKNHDAPLNDFDQVDSLGILHDISNSFDTNPDNLINSTTQTSCSQEQRGRSTIQAHPHHTTIHSSIDQSLNSHENSALFDHRPSAMKTSPIISSGRRSRSMSTNTKNTINPNTTINDITLGNERMDISKKNGKSNNFLFRRQSASNPLKVKHHATFNFIPTTATTNINPSTFNNQIKRRQTFAGKEDVVIDVDALMQSVAGGDSKNKCKLKHTNNSSNSILNPNATTAVHDKNSLKNNSSDSHSNTSQITTEEDYNSQPSSRGSSQNSSLDDVCLFLEDGSSIGVKIWPDCQILEEFSKEETDKLRKQAALEAEEFHFQFDSFDDVENETMNEMDILMENTNKNTIANSNLNESNNELVGSSSRSRNDSRGGGPGGMGYNQMNEEGIMFSHPIVSNIEVPELGNQRVNETEMLTPGRIRPKKLSPWHLKRLSTYGSISDPDRLRSLKYMEKETKLNKNFKNMNEIRDNFLVGGRGGGQSGHNIQYPPHIISNNPEHFRFTYFRPDLEQTVHSPTISGLLQSDQKFEDLFVAQQYTLVDSITNAVNNNLNPVSSRNTVTSPNASNAMGNRTRRSLLPSQSQNNLYHLNTNNNNNISGHTTTTTTTNNNNNNNNASRISNTTTTTNINDIIVNDSNINHGSIDEIEIEPFWLDVLNPTEEEMKVISKAFGIHPLTTEDIFLGEAHEKVEVFKDYYFVCFRSFDIVAERRIRHKKNHKHMDESNDGTSVRSTNGGGNKKSWRSLFGFRRRRSSTTYKTSKSNRSSNGSAHGTSNSSFDDDEEARTRYKRKSGVRHKPRQGELEPLNVYIIVFKTGILTFHFATTPHPINVRRRTRLLKDYLTVTADWVSYAIIDDITDSFAPMIEAIEDEVYDIEEAILKMHHGYDSEDSDDSDDDDDDDGSDESGESGSDDNVSDTGPDNRMLRERSIQSRRRSLWGKKSKTSGRQRRDNGSDGYDDNSMDDSFTQSSSISRSRSTNSHRSSVNVGHMMGWKKKGDMLRRIGECRKRVMSVMRLLSPKADVIKGLGKRQGSEQIDMYLSDIQDHIITMVSSLSHYEKLLSRSHSNYLAQLNIDMTRVNNDMNDVLGKITILGTVVLPMNVITGLWGMNVIVPGQPGYEEGSIYWFLGIVVSLLLLAWWAVLYTRRRFGSF